MFFLNFEISCEKKSKKLIDFLQVQIDFYKKGLNSRLSLSPFLPGVGGIIKMIPVLRC
jgi:hypothetical protein